MLDDFLGNIIDEFSAGREDINHLSPLVLAYIGDAVYEVAVRTLLTTANKTSVHRLHKMSVDFVKAKAQSDIIHRIMDLLTEEELEIVRRGRNAKSGTIPKNADVTEYKYATGFESLIGYLYLKKDNARLLQILRMSFDKKQ